MECELTSFGYRETQISYAARTVALMSDRKNYHIWNLGRFQSANPINPPFAAIGPWYKFKLAVKNGTYTAFVEDRKIHQSTLPESHDAWLALASKPETNGGVRNLRITGNPVIPESLALSVGPTLGGWLNDYYDDPKLWSKQGDEIVGSRLLDPEIPVDPANPGEARPAGKKGSKQESVLKYNRPMLEDGEIIYEFFYEPNEVMVHPALDRLTFLIEPDGVKIHWMTDAQHDRTGLGPDNTSIESDRRRGPATPPLNLKAWNRLKLSVAGDIATITLNDVVVQDPHTGQILALAIRPTFNPNDFKHTSPELLRDHAVSDVYEPGSTFKLVTYSAALDQHVTTPEQKIDCEGGKIVVAGRTVHDDHYNGVLTTAQALAESSDVAAIKLAERMGKDTFYSYIHAYGFGQRSGLELPGETRGLMKPPERWQPTTIGSVPMGQEVGVTPIQLVTMASTIANGGTYLPPHIVLRATDKVRGNPGLQPTAFRPTDTLPDPLPAGAHRVVTTLTAAQMRTMMEGVVLNGTAKGKANLNGYSAGGKTGTAQKIDVRTHTYSKTKYVASFVGIAPVNNPAVTIAVVIDSPGLGSHFGSSVSAPVFQELAQQILEYLGVPHDQPLKSAPELAKAAADAGAREDVSEPVTDLNGLFADVNDLPADDPLRHPAAAGQAGGENTQPAGTDAQAAAAGVPAGTFASAPMPEHAPVPVSHSGEALPPPKQEEELPEPGSIRVAAGHDVRVPDLVGSTVRAATERAGAIGLGVQVIGSGLAREQAPAPGSRVAAGTAVVVRFAR